MVNKEVPQAWFSYSFLLGFLVVFRTQQAYSRYWEGASLLQQLKGDWLNCVSNSFAFCSSEADKEDAVHRFQHLMARLMSLLHCAALQQVAQMDDAAFSVLDLVGVQFESLRHLSDNSDDRCVILIHWIEKLLVDNIHSGVLTIPAPIMSRAFQQLGNGVVSLINAQKITDIPFPFPYTQMVTLMLLIATIGTPLVTGLMIESPFWCAALTFMAIFGFWAVNFIAAEIEMPFGDDKNDLPIAELQLDFNQSLKILLHPMTHDPPGFALKESPTARIREITLSQGLISDLKKGYFQMVAPRRSKYSHQKPGWMAQTYESLKKSVTKSFSMKKPNTDQAGAEARSRINSEETQHETAEEKNWRALSSAESSMSGSPTYQIRVTKSYPVASQAGEPPTQTSGPSYSSHHDADDLAERSEDVWKAGARLCTGELVPFEGVAAEIPRSDLLPKASPCEMSGRSKSPKLRQYQAANSRGKTPAIPELPLSHLHQGRMNHYVSPPVPPELWEDDPFFLSPANLNEDEDLGALGARLEVHLMKILVQLEQISVGVRRDDSHRSGSHLSTER